MEIKVYLKLLQKRWWIVVSLLIITLAATAYFTLRLKPVYRAEATYIVRISAFAEERNIISALNTLTSRTEIAATYAGVANSSVVRNKAADALGISHPNSLSVKSQMKSGTNILGITVEGNDPVLVRDYTNAIGTQTVSYVESLYETYRLELLDEATLPKSPIAPNLMQNLTLGGILGFLLGIGLIIFIEYLKVPFATDAVLNILDERIGIYDMRYFRERLHQEMSRTRRHKSDLSVALVNIDHRRLLGSVSPQTRLDAMRSVVTALGKSLRDEDVMASLSDTELALLLPELDGGKAKIAVDRILAIVSKVSVELGPDGRNINLNGAAGIAPFYSGDLATTDVLITRARTVLDSMRESTYGRVMIYAEGPASGSFDDKREQSAEVKKAIAVQEQSETPKQAETISMEEGKPQEEQVEDTVAIQEQSEISEQENMVLVEESVGQNHNGKKTQNHKAKRNENGFNGLELSEPESS